MRTVLIDRTSIRTSRLGLGTSSLHHLVSSGARQRLLAHAWDRGVRYFDTAPLYGHEMAERELGRFMRGRREQLVIATKFGLLPSPLLTRFPALMYAQKLATKTLGKRVGGALAPVPHRNYGAAYARQRVERSLQALATDYIDILYLHEPTLAGLPEPLELVDALSELHRAGKIRAVGISGAIDSCGRITNSHPPLGQVWQADVHADTAAPGDALGARPAQVTFGHFRKAATVAANDDAARRRNIEQCLSEAVRLNPAGVILFSTRKTAHIDDMTALLSAIERQSDEQG